MTNRCFRAAVYTKKSSARPDLRTEELQIEDFDSPVSTVF